MSLSLKPSHLATYKDVAKLFLKHARHAQSDRDQISEKFELGQDIEPSENAGEFVNDLEKLGPTFIKLGQLLSTRPDLLPPTWLVALQRLQDDVSPFPFETVQQIIEAELGVRLSKAFDEFDEQPCATASLGQVHRAKLRNSALEVAVKVQRPDIKKAMLTELDCIAEVAEFLDQHTTFGKQYEPSRIVAQFRRSILRELDYLEEANNLARLRSNLATHTNIVVPEPIRDYSSTKVLTMAFISGTKITNLSGVVHTDLEGPRLADSLFSAYLQQVLVNGFFHADPHPGNLLLTRDRKIALLDLGMVGIIPDHLKDHLLQLLSAVAEGHSSRAAEIAIRIGTPRPEFDEDLCKQEIRYLVDDRQGANVSDIHVGQLVLEVTQVCGKNGLSIPDEMFMLGKMLLNLDLIAKTLDPEYDPDAGIRKYAAVIANRRIKDELSMGNLIHLITDVKELITNTPVRLNSFLKSLGNNQLRFKVDAVDEQLLLSGFQQVANRITTGLILSALIIGAAMLMNIESKFTLFGYPGLAIIFFLAAAIGGVCLVGSILLGDLRKK
ncbi:AarF/UbiB family protein [Verrucomicrobiaceae bacterium 227]